MAHGVKSGPVGRPLLALGGQVFGPMDAAGRLLLLRLVSHRELGGSLRLVFQGLSSAFFRCRAMWFRRRRPMRVVTSDLQEAIAAVSRYFGELLWSDPMRFGYIELWRRPCRALTGSRKLNRPLSRCCAIIQI
jgi:hypothetical protein